MRKRKKPNLILVIILVLLFLAIALLLLRPPEDDWITDSKGVWIKHGFPSNTPDYVLAQQGAIVCALELYNQSYSDNLSSECLGYCETYAIDIVSVPRTAEDDLKKNQCEKITTGKLNHFIELDKYGNLVRVA
jgi:hypothetical protein